LLQGFFLFSWAENSGLFFSLGYQQEQGWEEENYPALGFGNPMICAKNHSLYKQ
jgi:hypothetical protein